jgi:hypothetical protein
MGSVKINDNIVHDSARSLVPHSEIESAITLLHEEVMHDRRLARNLPYQFDTKALRSLHPQFYNDPGGYDLKYAGHAELFDFPYLPYRLLDCQPTGK